MLAEQESKKDEAPLDLETEEKEPPKQEKKKVIFVETDPQEAFPIDTISAIRKEINKQAKDFEVDWKSPVELVDFVFEELNVPKPLAYLKERWSQYLELVGYSVRALRDSRGMKAAWSRTY
jgi:hypothetical protein